MSLNTSFDKFNLKDNKSLSNLSCFWSNYIPLVFFDWRRRDLLDSLFSRNLDLLNLLFFLLYWYWLLHCSLLLFVFLLCICSLTVMNLSASVLIMLLFLLDYPLPHVHQYFPLLCPPLSESLCVLSRFLLLRRQLLRRLLLRRRLGGGLLLRGVRGGGRGGCYMGEEFVQEEGSKGERED